ncbi:transcriptional antiterminator, BglG family [Fontibacillus panacisegetis]|uniref:Transcriptional antiterminator, BglG family n=1 Tax=Fontibacillus panacisegetis TaxID=670482 RepID=A0A1G7F324_9BACL|nr:PRD domain-containing protein [Fontibacillus panacisegetis]SDE70299.1 transcriptional antiterminator, BglG family [Fontibacillus panacisegetis]
MISIFLIKALNNNIVLAQEEDGTEKVLFGTGIGFKKQKGDLIDVDKISQVFISDSAHSTNRNIVDFNPQILDVCAKIINQGESALEQKFGVGLLFSLADHITFALNNTEENNNPIKWEVPHLYYREYQVGEQALGLIKKETGKELLPEEASFIALHFVNAQIDQPNMNETIQITKLIKNIVKIIQTISGTMLDKTTANYSRFITHIRYFIIRQKNRQTVQKMDAEIRELIQERYMKSYASGLIIKDMLQRDFHWTISEDELIYLVIHIERITTK